MPPRCSTASGTLTPFLYPFLCTPTTHRTLPRLAQKCFSRQHPPRHLSTTPRALSSDPDSQSNIPLHLNNQPASHLNPPPSDYGRTIFSDRATVHLHAGDGGHGCISFLKEKYIAAGPANGGDGGYGGSIYIQAVRGETSLHKLARRNIIKAGRGKNGQGKTRGGERGDDIVIQVPVGTVVREIERVDPVSNEELKLQFQGDAPEGDVREHSGPYKWDRDKWLLYPAITPEDIATADFPTLPRARRSHLASAQEMAPINLDLSQPMEKPILLAAGAVGGLGNPHFVSQGASRPKYATKGSEGLHITLELELKLLADVGLVGLPNAGKSTLLRAVSNSRARVGNWAFTTLQPNIGTVVLDNHKGRPLTVSSYETGEPRTNYTIADIPGLVKDAHLDRGLGVSFLRHVERARVLAFVIDLAAGDAVAALKSLWREVGMYERMKIEEEAAKEKKAEIVKWSPLKASDDDENDVRGSSYHDKVPRSVDAGGIASKPWFVVASKADLEGSQENYAGLKAYLEKVTNGEEEHPSGQKDGYVKDLVALPISAINGHGVDGITKLVVGMLNE
ncbi:hypothetical protein V497_00824 [Pseudogymnoascus sp. VKM F-4516 (FW-969)]|nr:hypothetical protein V490_02548 [Pseudogymnoascus sp. VKM F-3557]KFY66597.1 hypothetical protein V497_00824 [Pseudogymnoascus sp. VKM F-4516 (FW-969)]